MPDHYAPSKRRGKRGPSWHSKSLRPPNRSCALMTVTAKDYGVINRVGVIVRLGNECAAAYFAHNLHHERE